MVSPNDLMTVKVIPQITKGLKLNIQQLTHKIKYYIKRYQIKACDTF